MNKRYEDVLKGLARNRATTGSVLLRMLTPGMESVASWIANRPDLPLVVVDAIVSHPECGVHGSFAESWRADPVQRARLVDDPEPRVRAVLAAGPMPFRRPVEPLPDEA